MADEAAGTVAPTLTETVIPPGKPKGVNTIMETVRRQLQDAGKAPSMAEQMAPTQKPVEAAKPAEAVKPAEGEKPRNTDGTFKEDPNKAQMREVIKRQQEEKKALEARLKALEAKATPETKPTVDPKREALLASMSPETRKWYETTGKELMGLDAQAVLAPHERALAKANKDLAEAEADAAWNSEFNDWMAGRLGSGEVVDERAMLAALETVEQHGWVLGKDNPSHFDAVLGMLRAQNPGAVAGIKTGKEAEDAARKQAEELTRAGGVRPGSAAPVNPQADREAELKSLREASMRGESLGPLLRKRMRGMGIFPEERGSVEGG